MTLLHEMARSNATKGLATLCVGGGQGVALAVERLQEVSCKVSLSAFWGRG